MSADRVRVRPPVRVAPDTLTEKMLIRTGSVRVDGVVRAVSDKSPGDFSRLSLAQNSGKSSFNPDNPDNPDRDRQDNDLSCQGSLSEGVGTQSTLTDQAENADRDEGSDPGGSPVLIPVGQRADLSALSGDPWHDGLAQLDPSQPATGVSWPAWNRIVAGCRSLLRRHGLDLRRLGWSSEDAFGLHRSVPFHGVHAWGLGPLLGDGEVVDLSATGAVIRRRDGSRQSYTRRPMPDAVPIWAVERDPDRAMSATQPLQPEPPR